MNGITACGCLLVIVPVVVFLLVILVGAAFSASPVLGAFVLFGVALLVLAVIGATAGKLK